MKTYGLSLHDNQSIGIVYVYEGGRYRCRTVDSWPYTGTRVLVGTVAKWEGRWIKLALSRHHVEEETKKHKKRKGNQNLISLVSWAAAAQVIRILLYTPKVELSCEPPSLATVFILPESTRRFLKYPESWH